MKLSLIATTFAAFFSNGYAENLRNTNGNLMDGGVPAAESSAVMETQGDVAYFVG
jgi:hypothetical protein